MKQVRKIKKNILEAIKTRKRKTYLLIQECDGNPTLLHGIQEGCDADKREIFKQRCLKPLSWRKR
jgi:hypothetical protein